MMKWRKYISIAGIMIMAFFWTPLQSSGTRPVKGIVFYQGTWDQALGQARKEDKMIFLDLYASWCGPCRMLQSETFPDAAVGRFFNANFINYAVDAEKGIGVKLARKFRITGYPTLLFIDGNGNLVTRKMGYRTPRQLITIGKQVVHQ